MLATPTACEDAERQELSIVAGVGECKMVRPLWKIVWWFLTKLNILLPYDPANTFGIYPKELKTDDHTKTCTQMFIATVFIIVKTWEQPRCLSVGE